MIAERIAPPNHRGVVSQLAEAKPREESVLTELSVSDRTNQQFDRIRRSMVAKQDQKPEKTKSVRSLLNKFLRV